MCWTETSDYNQSFDERVLVQWIDTNGQRRWGAGGFHAGDIGFRQFARDVGRDGEDGMFVVFEEVDAQQGTIEVRAQNVISGAAGAGEKLWESGRALLSAHPGVVRIMDDGSGGGAMVVWEENAQIVAVKLHRSGNPIWIDETVVISNRPGITALESVVPDEAGGAFVAFAALEGAEGEVYVHRVHENVVPNLSATLTTSIRGGSGGVEFGVGCPQGDQDTLVVELTFSGDQMTSIPADSITVPSQVGEAGVIVYASAYADSAPTLVNGEYRTTISVTNYGGCGVDSLAVYAYNTLLGHAPGNVRSPDMMTSGETNGVVDLMDFAEFGAHQPSSACDCIPNYLPYSECTDFAAPDTLVDLIDFTIFGSHFLHQAPQGGGSSTARAIALSAAAIAVELVETQPTIGGHTLTGTVRLENAEAFKVAFVALRNNNPILEFQGWQTDPGYANRTFAVDVVRDGIDQIAIGVVGGKNTGGGSITLGEFTMTVNSDEPVVLDEDDFALVTAELLSIGGTQLVVPTSSFRRETKPVTYRNELAQNYPNPFNPSTTIAYSIATAGSVELRLYNVAGQLVKTLVSEEQAPGRYALTWAGDNNAGNRVASGVYFYRIEAKGFSATRKLVLLK